MTKTPASAFSSAEVTTNDCKRSRTVLPQAIWLTLSATASVEPSQLGCCGPVERVESAKEREGMTRSLRRASGTRQLTMTQLVKFL